MIDFNSIKDGIYDWINGETGKEVIYQFQNIAIPDKPFFSLRLMNFIQVGDASHVPAATQTDAGEWDFTTNVDFQVQILGFGPGIVEETIKLQMSLNRPDIHQDLFDAGVISWNGDNPVLDISGLDNDENEERSSHDVNMRTVDIVTDVPLGVIEIVNAEGTFKQPGRPDIIRDINVDAT